MMQAVDLQHRRFLPLLSALQETSDRDQLEETLRISPQTLGQRLMRARLEGLVYETPTGKVRLTRRGKETCQ